MRASVPLWLWADMQARCAASRAARLRAERLCKFDRSAKRAIGGAPVKRPDLEKKVGEQLTLAPPANVAEFGVHINRGLRRQGFLTPDRERAPGASRKGCQQLSRGALQGARAELVEHLPPDAPPEALAYLAAKWDDQQAVAMLAQSKPHRDHWEADPARIFHEHRPAGRLPVDRRGKWKPATPAVNRPLRSAMYGLQDGMRPLSQPRVQACNRACIAPSGNVGVMATPDGRVKLCGLAHCGSVWECAMCQMVILQAQAEQLSNAVQRHGPDRVVMLTLTFRHGAGDSLKRMRKNLTRAYAGLMRHRATRAWLDAQGVIGKVRAIEVTHGDRNGWHPHLHVLLFLDEPAKTATVQGDGGRFRKVWDPPELAELSDLWAKQVVRVFGAKHRPNRDRGLRATMARDGEYLAKMGLELTDPAIKQGHRSTDGELHRSPWQIAASWVGHFNAWRATLGPDDDPRKIPWRLINDRDAQLWRTYRDDMRGAHRLVWSNGLKQRLDVRDTTDQESLEDDEATQGDTWIASVPGATWKAIRDLRIHGEPVPLYLIREAERGGSAGFDAALLKVAAGECSAR